MTPGGATGWKQVGPHLRGLKVSGAPFSSKTDDGLIDNNCMENILDLVALNLSVFMGKPRTFIHLIEFRTMLSPFATGKSMRPEQAPRGLVEIEAEVDPLGCVRFVQPGTGRCLKCRCFNSSHHLWSLVG